MFENNRVGSQDDQAPVSTANATTSASMPAMQRKIISHFITHPEPKTVYSEAPDPAVDRQDFLKKLLDGEITTIEENQFLDSLPVAVNKQNLNQVFSSIAANPLEKQILAVMMGHNIDSWEDLKPRELLKLIAKPHFGMPDYRTPVGFRELRQEFLSEIRPKATPQEFDDYIAAMNSLESKIYGERVDYYKAFEALFDEVKTLDQTAILKRQSLSELTDPNQTVQSAPAPKPAKPVAPPPPAPDVPTAPAAPTVVPETPQFFTQVTDSHTVQAHSDSTSSPDQSSTAPAATTPEPSPTPKPAPATPSAQSETAPKSTGSSFRFTAIDDERRDQTLSHAIIDGDAWHQGNQDYHLNINSLANSGLVPAYELTFDGCTIYLSNVFQLSSEHSAAIGYVQSSDSVKTRSFYRDKNQALWHYLPDYIRDISGEGIDAFGTGFDERSTVLPLALQTALNQIEKHRGFFNVTTTNPDFIFAGTAHAYNTRQEFRDAYSKGILKGDFYHEVSPRAYNADASNLIAPNRRKTSPQLISINAQLAPDFDHSTARFMTYSAFAGQLLGEGFPSHDQQSTWLLFSDYRSRCWIGNIETNSILTSTGCRKEWLLLTDITTPLYELTHLADGYGDPGDTRAGSYTSMWNNYLSRIPLIEQYVEYLNRKKSQAQ